MRLWSATILTALAIASGCGKGPSLSPVDQIDLSVRRGQYSDAIKAASHALEQNPQDAAMFLIRGRAYHYRGEPGDLERTIADFGEAIRLEPKNFTAYYGRALAYRDHGDADEAAEDDNQARELDLGVREYYERLPDFSERPLISPEHRGSESDVTDSNSANRSDPLVPRTNDAIDYLARPRRTESNPASNTPAERSGQGAVAPNLLPPLPTRSPAPLPSQGLAPRMSDPDFTRPGAGGDSGSLSRSRAADRLPPPVNPFAPPGDGFSPMRQSTQDVGRNRFPPPVQSPFPQAGPRPTGVVPEPLPGNFRASPQPPVIIPPRTPFSD